MQRKQRNIINMHYIRDTISGLCLLVCLNHSGNFNLAVEPCCRTPALGHVQRAGDVFKPVRLNGLVQCSRH